MWFKVDDAFWAHPKVIALSSDAVALWTLAGSWSGQQGTSGHVPASMLPLLRGKAKGAGELVKAGLWRAEGDGWTFHDWHVYNFDAETVQARKARQSAAGIEANHVRWHVGSGKKSESCQLCSDSESESESDRSSDGSSESDRNPPVPSRPDPLTSDMTNPPASVSLVDARASESDGTVIDQLRRRAEERAAGLNIVNLGEVREWLERATGMRLTFGQAVELAASIIGRAKRDVDSGDRYVIGTCRKSPARVLAYAEDLDLEAVA